MEDEKEVVHINAIYTITLIALINSNPSNIL